MCAEYLSDRKLREISESQAAKKKLAGEKLKKLSQSPDPPEHFRILYLAPGSADMSLEAEYARSIAAKLQDSGQQVFFLPFPHGPLGWPSYLLSFIKRLRGADIVHLNLTRAGTFAGAVVAALLLAKFFGRPTTLYMLAPDIEPLIQSWPRIVRPLVRLPSLVVAPDKYLCELLSDSGASVINVPPAPELYSQSFRQARQIQPRILVTDPFALPGGPQLALQVFAHVKEKYPRTELTFCASGAEHSALKKALDQLALPGVETVCCECGSDRQAEFLSHDVYLQTPRYDNSQLRLFEALAAKIPVVSSNAGGIEEFVSDRVHAHVIDDDSHVALAERILEIVANPAAAAELAASGLERAEELAKRSPVKVWSRIFEALIQSRPISERMDELIAEPVKRGL